MVPGDNAESFLDGQVADYRASSILKADCRIARFVRAVRQDLETAKAVELASGAGAGIFSNAPRKMLISSVVSP